jgi:hypothetical protein
VQVIVTKGYLNKIKIITIILYSNSPAKSAHWLTGAFSETSTTKGVGCREKLKSTRTIYSLI